MHQSKYQGRKINVELTVGGGGHAAARKTKIAEKNKKYLGEKGGAAGGAAGSRAAKPGKKSSASSANMDR